LQELAYASSLLAPSPSCGFQRFLFGLEDDWEIPIIAPVEGRKTAAAEYVDAAAAKRWALFQNPCLPSCCTCHLASAGV
jgi:hypothetical protein